jgi:hypothetical protein
MAEEMRLTTKNRWQAFTPHCMQNSFRELYVPLCSLSGARSILVTSTTETACTLEENIDATIVHFRV